MVRGVRRVLKVREVLEVLKVRGVQRNLGLLAALGILAAVAFTSVSAQTRFTYNRGQPLNPAYEGWWTNDDGSSTIFFGYFNTNWEQEFDIPIGPENSIEPGGPDQGQPTHFYPRRNPFLFTVRVPKDFGSKELVWTLTANGQTNKAYASLKPDYYIDKQVISTEIGGDNGSLSDSLRTNIPPELKVEGELRRTAKVGQPMELVAWANDPDNIPPRRGGARGRGGAGANAAAPGGGTGGAPAPAGRGGAEQPAARGQAPAAPPAARGAAPGLPRGPVAVTASSGAGLRFSWIVYRGNADVVDFNPEQMKTWEDTRAYGNSPWSPPYVIPEPPADNRWISQVTFKEPGTYVLRGVASDGSLFTYENVTVTVTR